MAEESTNYLKQRKERVGKYEILSHIATGGMGAIYKARDLDLDRLVALKILNPELAKQQKILDRFRREAKASARLRHENIVAIFDVGYDEKNDTHFLALEFVEGTDLQDYITRKQRLNTDEALQIMIQATRALVHAHEHGVVHRDIKPSNFLLATRGTQLLVKLTDFGLALRNESDEEHRITRDGTTVGTVDYISPEQALNSSSVDVRSDIYSLGCTFFHMLGGTAPFARGSLAERIVLHLKKPPPDVRRLNKHVPESLCLIIKRMLAKKPEDRQQTPAELLQALEDLTLAYKPEKQQGPVDAAAPKLARGLSSAAEPTTVMNSLQSTVDAEELKQARATRPNKDAGLPLVDNNPGVFDLSEEPRNATPSRAKAESVRLDAEKAPESLGLSEEPRQVKTNREHKDSSRPDAEKGYDTLGLSEEPRQVKPNRAYKESSQPDAEKGYDTLGLSEEPRQVKPNRGQKERNQPYTEKAPETLGLSEEPGREKKARPKKPVSQLEPEKDHNIDHPDKSWTLIEDIDDDESDQDDASFDQDDDDLPSQEKPNKDAKPKRSVWAYVVPGALGAFALVLVLGWLFEDRPSRPKKEVAVKPIPEPEPIEVIPDKIIEAPIERPPVEVIDTSPTKMSAGPLPLPVMDTIADKPDRAALRKEFRGPFTNFPEPPLDARTLRLQRLGTGPAAFRTLAEALAKSEPKVWTIIDIHDNGPIYVPYLPDLTQRFIVLRGAAGYRPLLAWEVPRSSGKEKSPAALLSLTQGKLFLENLDIVAKWPEEQPSVLFDLQDSDFCASGCTFSLITKSQQGITVVRHRDSKEVGNNQRMPQTWFKRCHVRGPDVTLLSARKSAATVLLEESLIIGQNQPLFELQERDADPFELRCIRSTLVAGQFVLRWQALSGKKGVPQVQGYVLDSILSRNDPDSPLGDMVHLAEGAEPTRMKWRATNSVYAGWKRLLACNANPIAGVDLSGWRRQWFSSRGDRALVEPWPSNPLSRLEEVPANMFLLPATSPVTYAALTGSGAIGSVIGWLPEAPASWLEHTFDPPRIPAIATADFDPPPTIPPDADGLYHGEKLDLNKIDDLGAYLNTVLQKKKPAAQVILHLTGKGIRLTSSIRIKGIDNLVIYFEQPHDFKDALKLGVNPTSVGKRFPVIEMIEGNLELIGARIELSNVSFTPSIIHVHGGDLTLTRCRLLGPLTKSAGGFKSLITVTNNNGKTATVWLRNNLLLSGKSLIHLQDDVQLRARNNVFLSLGDGLHYEGTGTIGSLMHVLDHNTWAVRHTAFTLATGPDFLTAAPILSCANSNAFINPFAEDADKAILLRGAEAAVTRGQWTWHGRFNVYDRRLHAYVATNDPVPDGKQALKGWKNIWGAIGEQDSLLFEPGATSKTISVDVVTPGSLLSQLDRLALPAQVRGDPSQPPPGADLVALGILRKKG